MRAAGILNETSRNSIGYFPLPGLSWPTYLACDGRSVGQSEIVLLFIWSVFPPTSDNDDDDEDEDVEAVGTL